MNIFNVVRFFLRNKRSGLRYRWGYNRARLQHAIDSRSSGEGLLFVTGFDKSGTTWLRRLLNEHPEIRCYGCGQFFNYYKEDVHFLGNPGGYRLMVQTLLENPWYKGSGHDWLSREGVEAFVRQTLEGSMLSFKNSDKVLLVGDKSTAQDCFLIRKLFPKAYIVAIVRDGRDVAVSFAYHFKRRGNPNKFKADGRLDPKYLEDVAKAWAIYNEHIQSFVHKKDERFFLTKYEDLLMDPQQVLHRLLTFLHVDADMSLVTKVISHNRFQMLSRGREPGKQDEHSFFRKGISGDWENHFGDEETSIFETQAGDILRAYGYGMLVG